MLFAIGNLPLPIDLIPDLIRVLGSPTTSSWSRSSCARLSAAAERLL